MFARRLVLSGLVVAVAIVVAALLIVKFVLLGSSPAQASFTTLSVISGTVEVRDEGAGDFRPAEDGETLDVGDRVRTGADSRALITFFEGSTLEMEPETEVTMERLEGQEEGGFFTQIGQSLGVTWHRVVEFTDPRSAYEVDTPSAVAAVRGTLFQAGVGAFDVFAGKLAVHAHGVEKIVDAGMSTQVTPGGPPLDPFQSPPPPSTLELELNSAAIFLAVTPNSTGAGLMLQPGGGPDHYSAYPINQEPGTTATGPGEEPQVVLFRRVVDGTYEVFLFGIANGTYGLDVTGRANDRIVCQGHVEGSIEEGERWLISIAIDGEDGLIQGCDIGDPQRTSRDPGIALVLRESLGGRYWLPRPFVAAPSPTRTATTVPTPSPTPAATPTIVPQVLSMVVAPTFTPPPPPMLTPAPTPTSLPPAPKLTVTKVVEGQGEVGDFTLRIDGEGVSSGVTYLVSPGAHVVSEDDPGPGYSSVIGGDCDGAGNVTMAAGQDKECTITNTAGPGSIEVVKDVIGDVPDSDWEFTGPSGSFSLPAEGGQQTFSGLAAGQYTIGETTKDGYAAAVSCSPGGETGSDSVTVDLDPGESVICTFINSGLPGSITVVKNVAGVSPYSEWEFTGTSPIEEFTLPAAGGDETFSDLEAGEYTISEITKDAYAASVSCSPGGETGSNSVSVNLGVDESIICTFTNTALPGSIKVVKKVVGEVPSSGWGFTGTSPIGKFTLAAGGGEQTLSGLKAGRYTIIETINDSYLTSVSCSPGGEAGKGSVSVGLDPGESVTCTFTNTFSSADFVVNKDFVPDSGASVSVSLSCTSGTVVTTPLQASEGAPAVFTVKRYEGDPMCTASESPIPAGYDSTGTCAASLSVGECTITNTLRSHQFTVKKDFVPNSGASVSVSLGCTSGAVSPASGSASEGSPAVFTVTGYEGNATCTATESPVPTGYDSSGTCAASLSVGECTITNTLRSHQFTVKKDFVPNSAASVSVSLGCTSGAVSPAGGSASEGSPAVFTVTGYEGNPTCTATESPVPTGYDSSGKCGAALVGGGECTITNTLRSHQFTVKKDFVPNSGASVSVSLGCTSGVVSPASGSASEASPVVFTVTGYEGNPTCTATESPVPTGYDSSGACGASLSVGECTITNTLRSHQFTVKKDFVPNSGASITVSLTCSSGTVLSAPLQASEAAPAVFTVQGFASGTTCTASETVPSGYSADQSDCLNVGLVSDAVCTIRNTSLRKPVDVMLVIDRSGSMGDPPVPIADVKAAAKALVDKLDPNVDQVGLVSYADSATLDHELAGGESGFGEVKGAIDGLSTGGYTNIGDGVLDAQTELNNHGRPDAVPVMVVLTDGIANRQNKPPPEHRCTEWPSFETGCTQFARSEAEAAKAQGTVIFTVGLNLAWSGHPEAGALARSILRDMATQPWSDYYFETGSPGDLVGIFEQIAGIITNMVTSAETVGGGSDGSDPLAAALALAATAPMVAVISISRLRRRR
jgi:hypothetical protein